MPGHPPQLVPDILRLLGGLLTPPDLLSCVQVCRAWNEELIPSLWETIDDSLYMWPLLLDRYDTKNSQHHKDGAWVRAIFSKHAHYIRHLRTSRKVVIAAVTEAKTCTKLRSLYIGDISERRAEAELLKSESYKTLSAKRFRWQMEGMAPPWPLLSPQFEGNLLPVVRHHLPESAQEQNWMVFQGLWLLLLQNPALQRIRLGTGLESLGKIASVSFILSIIKELEHLVDFQNHCIPVDFTTFLNMFPKVTSYGGAFTVDIQHMQDYTQLRELRILNPLTEPEVFHLLDHLPSLERLRIWEIRQNRNNGSAFSPPLNLQYGLKSLTVLANGGQTKAPVNILARLPLLTEFVTDCLAQNTAKTLVKHCPQLEILRQPSYLKTTQLQRTPLNTLNLVLKGCRRLKVVDMYNHHITISELIWRPWVSLKLEVLRFQVVKVSRLSDQEKRWVNEGMRVTKTKDEESLFNYMKNRLHNSITLGLDGLHDHRIFEAMETREHYLITQRRAMDQLAKLTNLRVLDFGYDYKDTYDKLYIGRLEQIDGQVDAPFYVVPNTLELGIGIDLPQLAALKKLEVFGFEGVDHRIGKKELEWIAEAWPKLRVMHGLQEKQLGSYAKSMELREYMQTLRPDVKHLPKLPCPY